MSGSIPVHKRTSMPGYSHQHNGLFSWPWPAKQESSSRGRISSPETFENLWRQYEEGHRRPFLHIKERERMATTATVTFLYIKERERMATTATVR